jgi:hypothetical protein
MRLSPAHQLQPKQQFGRFLRGFSVHNPWFRFDGFGTQVYDFVLCHLPIIHTKAARASFEHLHLP